MVLPGWFTIAYVVHAALVPVNADAFPLRSALWIEVPQGWEKTHVHLENADVVCLDDNGGARCFAVSVKDRRGRLEVAVERGGRIAVFSCGQPQRSVWLYRRMLVGTWVTAKRTVPIGASDGRGCVFDLLH